jgi:DNA-directed RNA polymerase specialized sigma24 family protein
MGLQGASGADLLAVVARATGARSASWYERHTPRLAAHLRRRCADPDVVAKALQDTWRRVRKAPLERERCMLVRVVARYHCPEAASRPSRRREVGAVAVGEVPVALVVGEPGLPA